MTAVDFTNFVDQLATASGDTILPFFRTALAVENKKAGGFDPVTAADRVGIVYSVTGALLDLGGNVLELSQTVMRGYFTLILEASFPTPRSTQQLADAIQDRHGAVDAAEVLGR